MKISRYTAAGMGAVLLWSTTVAFSRSLSESLGPLTTGACIYTLGGLFSLAAEARRPGEHVPSSGGLARLANLPSRYVLVCGGLFVGYMLLLYLAVGLAHNRAQVIAVGLANYLWPVLILLFSLPIHHKRARLWLLPAIALALGGTWLAAAGGDLVLEAGSGLLPVLLAAAAALLWGLYSNVIRLWGPAGGSGVPLFLLASGLAFIPLRFAVGETSAWNWSVAPGLLYMAVLPAWLGYRLWDEAMLRGDLVLVTVFSYFTPLLSTLVSLLVLGVPFTPRLAAAAVLVTAGAVLSRMGVEDNHRDSEDTEKGKLIRNS